MPTPPVANPATIAAVEDVLKEVYVADQLESQLQEEVMLLEWFEETTEYTDSDGLKASVPLKIGRSGGIGARGVGEQLPSADHQKPRKASYNYKNLYLQIQVYGPVVARMETNRQSAIREIDFEINGGIEDMQKDMQRQLHSFGDASVLLAALPGNASSTTILLGASNYPVLERGWLYEGLAIDVGSLVTPTAIVEGRRILSVNDSPSAPSITISGAAITPTAGSLIFIHGNRSASGSNELNGLGNLVDDTVAVGGIDPTNAGDEKWKATVEHNSGTLRDLTIARMNNLHRKVRQKGGKVSDIWGSLGMQQKYYELLQAQVRFAGDTKLAAGRVEGPEFNGKIFVGDPDALPNRVYMLAKKHLMMFSAGPIAWQNQTTGGNILAWRQDFDAFVARAAKYCQVGTNRRSALGVLEDLNEPAA